MIKKWRINDLPQEKLIISERLSNDLGISNILCKLLVQREVTTFDEAKAFFRPSLDQLLDPFLMKDMDKAVNRLNKALKRQEKILIYGDYDVDGTTSVALFYTFLNRFTSHLGYYIPDRYSEGYGISTAGIDYAKANGFTLIVALDCGIKAVKKVEYATGLGIDFIICDHHTPSGVLPAAVAVLDPKREDCTYPYPHLSGCGVGFKLAHAFAIDNEQGFETIENHLDLLAVSIASDIVPIDGENRVFAHFGMERLNHHPSKGIKAIINQCNLVYHRITISDIVFKIGPRINASGRIDQGSNAVKLMIASNEEEALEMSLNIDEFNDKRKTLDKNITEEAIALIVNDKSHSTKHSVVLYNENWSKGVIGIVASRVVESHYKPTVILTQSNDKITGSARSVSGFNLYDAVAACKEHLDTFGGHKYAAGMTLKKENMEAFALAFENYVAEHITEEQKHPQLNIDCELNFKDITPSFCKILHQFAPHGPKNFKPVFVSYKVKDAGGTRCVGSNEQHLKLELLDPLTGVVFGGIAFNYSAWWPHLKAGGSIDICYTIEENHYNGKLSYQIHIKDIRESEITTSE